VTKVPSSRFRLVGREGKENKAGKRKAEKESRKTKQKKKAEKESRKRRLGKEKVSAL